MRDSSVITSLSIWKRPRTCTVHVFEQEFALEDDAIGSHACSLEALACV
jgi:hypothetical protein